MVRAAATGRLYGIGVGPGDPELLTLKAVRILAAVPVVAYPAPEGGRSTARRIAAAHIVARREIAINVPMRPGSVPAGPYDAGAKSIADELEQGHDVAVLCEGDPLFYGTYVYLQDRLADRYTCEVVPGVTSLTACAAAVGQALARRTGTLTVLPATLGDAELRARLYEAESVAILKVGRHLSRLTTLLREMGLADRATFVAHATRPDQVVRPLEACGGMSAPYFSMILVPPQTGGSD